MAAPSAWLRSAASARARSCSRADSSSLWTPDRRSNQSASWTRLFGLQRFETELALTKPSADGIEVGEEPLRHRLQILDGRLAGVRQLLGESGDGAPCAPEFALELRHTTADCVVLGSKLGDLGSKLGDLDDGLGDLTGLLRLLSSKSRRRRNGLGNLTGLLRLLSSKSRRRRNRLVELPGEVRVFVDQRRLAALSDEPFAQDSEVLPDDVRGAAVARHVPEKPPDVCRQLGSNADDSDSVAVQELEAWIARFELQPEFPDAEVGFADVGIVQQHDGRGAELRQPRFEIVPDRVIRMQAVDVEQVDGSVAELQQGLVERRTDDPREGAEVTVVKVGPFLEDVIAIEPGLMVALPGVHRVAGGIDVEVLNRLREGRVAVPGMRAELDEHARPQHVDQPEGERNVGDPARRIHQAQRTVEHHRPQHDLQGGTSAWHLGW